MAQAISPARDGLARLSAAELCVVRAFAWSARPAPIRSLAVALSWLGNGWAYLAIALASLMAAGTKALPALAIGAFNAGLLHCLYPSIKRWVARPRPYRNDTTLRPLLRALDEHSFPSGHAMTLSAALLPLVLAFPQTFGLAIVIGVLMAWARLASAHHYPSDVVAGTALGFAVSYPFSLCAFAASRLVP
jgi:undecaprenyl-diphosphatase